MPKVKKIFTEYGLDFDNNKYGFGRSTEYEHVLYQTEQRCEPMNQLNSKKYMQDISEFGLGGLFLS